MSRTFLPLVFWVFAMSALAQVRPLADDFTVVYRAPNPKRLHTYSPGILRLADGRLIASIDIHGPDLKKMPGPKGRRGGRLKQGKVFTSDDGGQTWTHRADFAIMHERPFVAGDAVYILGQMEDLYIIRSDDRGETWSEPARLSEGQQWTQAPANVHYANGCVYLAMHLRPYPTRGIWPVSVEAPVLMRAKVGDDLTKPESWTFASTLAFRDAVKAADLDYFGVPFYESAYDRATFPAKGRPMNPIGWLEGNVVQFRDPDHLWYDADRKTFHIWMRAHTGTTNLAAIAKVVEQGDEPGTGPMKTMLEVAPSGRKMVYVPCPGGQMKFHVLYDEQTKLYWLLSTQSTDSMTRPDRLPPDRYNLPDNERRRLQLHFSKNMVDWCFAGLVAVGETEVASRHYASMAFDGDDLVVLSRSGDKDAKTPHDGNIITFHRVKNFRELVY